MFEKYISDGDVNNYMSKQDREAAKKLIPFLYELHIYSGNTKHLHILFCKSSEDFQSILKQWNDKSRQQNWYTAIEKSVEVSWNNFGKLSWKVV